MIQPMFVLHRSSWVREALALGALLVASGCGADAGTGGASGAGGSGGSGGTGGTGDSAMPTAVNGCNSSTAINMTAGTVTTIGFDGIEYTPRCVRVRGGSTVVFMGDFTAHPLVGGTVEGGVATPDPRSPIPATSSGGVLSFPIASYGAQPYYCTRHLGSGMMGAIFVE